MALINGGPMTERLEMIAAKFMCIRSVERSIERPHRLSKMETGRAPHHSGAFLSSRFRIGEVEHLLKQPDFLTELAGR